MSKILHIVLSCLMCFVLFGTFVSAQNGKQSIAVVSQAEAKQWQDDLRYMAEEMPRWHKNLFHTITPAQFNGAIKNLHDRIPQLARHQIIVEMARIAAMIGDGHTNVAPTRDAKIGFRALPVKFYLFKDGLFVRVAARENAALVGTRVVKIGNLPPEQAIARVREIISRDNEMGVRFFAPHLLAMPEILHALKVADEMESVSLVVQNRDGKQQTVVLKPFGTAELLPPDTDTTWINKEGWVDMRDGGANVPLWLKNPNDRFRFEMLPDSRAIYVQINQVANKADETLAAFARRLFAFAETNAVEKMILDLRLNRGGDGSLRRPLLLEIIKSKLNQPGKLFVLMGRSTWSAAQFVLDDLESYTNAVFVGEPSGSKGNHYGDSRRIALPNSGITVRVSNYYWQQWSPDDERLWTTPRVTAELSSEDYRTNGDPTLRAALDYVPRPTLLELLNESLSKGSVEAAVKKFQEFKSEPANKYAATEEPLLIAGSRLLRENKPEQALVLFKLNAAENPHSSRAYYALGEAYFQSGNREPAIKNYEKALEINPKYYNANEKLKSAKKN